LEKSNLIGHGSFACLWELTRTD